jgi:hypothetical protein
MIRAWSHWDSGWFLSIARYGYPQLYAQRIGKEIGSSGGDVFNFFPMYPMAIKAISYLTQETGFPVIAALIVSDVSFILSVYVIYRLLSLDYERPIIDRTLLVLILFPAAFFLTSAYYESLFLLLSLSAFYMARRQNWTAAGMLGMMVALTVGFGVLIFFPLLMEFLSARGLTLTTIKDRRTYVSALPLLLVPMGTFAFMLYSYSVTGNLFEFAVATRYWYVQFSPPWRAVLSSARLLIEKGVSSYFLRSNAVNLAFALTAILLTIYGWVVRKVRISYLTWSTMVLLVLLSAFRVEGGPYPPITAFPLFMLRVWPLFLLMGIILSGNRLMRLLVLTMSTVLLTFMCALFVNGYIFPI